MNMQKISQAENNIRNKPFPELYRSIGMSAQPALIQTTVVL